MNILLMRMQTPHSDVSIIQKITLCYNKKEQSVICASYLINNIFCLVYNYN